MSIHDIIEGFMAIAEGFMHIGRYLFGRGDSE